MNRSQDQRSTRPAKPPTIHTCALSGDLLGLQKLLRDNPNLLNGTNPVVRFPFSLRFYQLGISKISPFFLLLLLLLYLFLYDFSELFKILDLYWLKNVNLI